VEQRGRNPSLNLLARSPIRSELLTCLMTAMPGLSSHKRPNVVSCDGGRKDFTEVRANRGKEI